MTFNSSHLFSGNVVRSSFWVQSSHTDFLQAGAIPDRKMPSVLVSTRLTEVRGFSDFFSEFFQVSLEPSLSDC